MSSPLRGFSLKCVGQESRKSVGEVGEGVAFGLVAGDAHGARTDSEGAQEASEAAGGEGERR